MHMNENASHYASSNAGSFPSPCVLTFGAWNSKESRQDPPRDLPAVKLPILAIFPKTPLFVSEDTVEEYRSDEEEVRPREQVLKSTDGTHGESLHQVSEVICMARKAPPAC